MFRYFCFYNIFNRFCFPRKSCFKPCGPFIVNFDTWGIIDVEELPSDGEIVPSVIGAERTKASASWEFFIFSSKKLVTNHVLRHHGFRNPEAQPDTYQKRKPHPDRLEDQSEIEYGCVNIFTDDSAPDI